MQLPNLTHFTR